MAELREKGSPFDFNNAKTYKPFKVDDYKQVIIGAPVSVKKTNIYMQLADLVLWPMAKGGYEQNYPPYLELVKNGKIIDCHLDDKDIKNLGIKYSCFDGKEMAVKK